MSSIRTTRFTFLLTRTVRGGPTRALVQRPISTLRATNTNTRPAVKFQPSPLQRIAPTAGTRSLASLGGTSGKRDADLLVDELQELYFFSPHPPIQKSTLPQKLKLTLTKQKNSYEVAKDEFEIATDSTDSATIYAASDRESARDALNQLLTTYRLYTSGDIRPTSESHQPQQTQPDDSGVGAAATEYDPADIKPEVRDEVRLRVGQRVKELDNAVMVLEEKAMED